MARRPHWRLALIVLVGLLGVAAVAAVTEDEDDGGDEAPTSDAPEAFLEAWSRSRSATFRTVARFTRTSNQTAAAITDQIVTIQRPPDILTIDRDGASGLVDGERLACVFRDRALDCESARAQRTYEDDVERQLETLESYVVGDDPLYTTIVSQEGDARCFRLELTRPGMVAPPLGLVSTYCFSEANGVPVRTTIERAEADDELRVVSIDTEVTDADLDPATTLRG